MDEGFGHAVRDSGSDFGVAMLIGDVDQARLFVITGAAFAHGLDFQTALQRAHERGQPFSFDKIFAGSRRCERGRQRQLFRLFAGLWIGVGKPRHLHDRLPGRMRL